MFTVKPEISIGDLLTIVSVVVSIIALLVSWRRHQELQRKEYADRIRRSAGTVVAKLHRWKDLTLRFYEDVQPLITEADMTQVKAQNFVEVRDLFWHGLSIAHSKSSQRILEEQIEIAYVDLYGYDPKIQVLFNEVLDRLKLIDNSIFTLVLYSTQSDILRLSTEEGPYISAQLGNKLRNTCYQLREECKSLMDDVIAPFSLEMIKLIEQEDQSILERRSNFHTSQTLYPMTIEQLGEQLDTKVKETLRQTVLINLSEMPRTESIDSILVNLVKSGVGVPQMNTYRLGLQDEVHRIFADHVGVFEGTAQAKAERAELIKALQEWVDGEKTVPTPTTNRRSKYSSRSK